MRPINVLLSMVLTTAAPFSHSITFPLMVSAEITQCKRGGQGECSDTVRYSGTSELLDIGAPVVPAPSDLVRIDSFGVHCNIGDASRNIPFSRCNWDVIAGSHSPRISNCLVEKGTWILSAGSTCATTPTWGVHNGAAPGGECVLFGTYNGSDVVTPFGTFSAVQVANSGNRFCIKPLPPGVTCVMELPSLINHGTILLGSMDSKIINGKVNCGSRPVVTIVGSPSVILSPGVSTKLSATMSSATDLSIQSDMTVGRTAKAGEYSASVIVSVSPY
jgi:hypothetical protein